MTKESQMLRSFWREHEQLRKSQCPGLELEQQQRIECKCAARRIATADPNGDGELSLMAGRKGLSSGRNNAPIECAAAGAKAPGPFYQDTDIYKENGPFSLDRLYDAAMEVRTSCHWKKSWQTFSLSLLRNLMDLRSRLVSGKYHPRKPRIFMLTERGKKRRVCSYSIEDKIVDKCLVQNILNPIVLPLLLKGNTASQKGKGTDFHIALAARMLKRAARENIRRCLPANSGYALMIDFKKFFDNVSHDVALKCFRDVGVQEDAIALIDSFLSLHEVDLKLVPPDVEKRYRDGLFDAVEYEEFYSIKSKNDESGRKLRISTGLGSELSQLIGLFLPHRIDTLLANVLALPAIRYMDDILVISDSKEALRHALQRVREEASRLHMRINDQKTRIVPLRSGVTVLKRELSISSDGYIHIRHLKGTVSRCINSFHAWARKGIGPEKAKILYESRRRSIVRHDGIGEIAKADIAFERIYGHQWPEEIIWRNSEDQREPTWIGS